MKLSIFPSPTEAARSLMFHLVDIINAEPDEMFSITVSDGSVSASMFDLWVNEYADTTPRECMKLYWIGERCTPPKDSDNNYGMMCSLLLGIVPIPYENVYRVCDEEKPAKEAARYSELVSRQVLKKDDWLEFDIILLGAGDDGYTSPIFPGQEALLSSDQIYVTSTHPRNGQKRIAITGFPILTAYFVTFLITGKAKAEVVEEVCYSGDMGPAAYIAHHMENVELFMDAGAAMYVQND